MAELAEPRLLEHRLGTRLPLPVFAWAVYGAARLLNVAVVGLLLPHGRFRALHWSLRYWMSRSWDGGHYQGLAIHGYAHSPGIAHAAVYALFPGYPAAVRMVSLLPWTGTGLAGLIVTFTAGLAAAWGLARLGLLVSGCRRTSLLLVALWAVSPGSIVLSMMYSEALFCALAVWALVALAQRQWLAAAGLTAVAGLVRGSSVALIAALAVAAAAAICAGRCHLRRPASALLPPLAALVIAPLGLVGYWGYVAAQTGRLDGWFWIEARDWHMSFDAGASTVRAARTVLTGAASPPALMTVLVIAAALLLTAWTLTERLPVYLHVYTLAVVLSAVTENAGWLGSTPRYLLSAMLLGYPLARALALVPVRARVLVPLLIIAGAGSTWFSLYLMSTGWAP